MSGISVDCTNDNGLDPDEFFEAVEECFYSILNDCPVDTGYLYSSWDMKKQDDDYIVLETMCDYASYLEDGHSKAQPRGFVEVNLRYYQDKFEWNMSYV